MKKHGKNTRRRGEVLLESIYDATMEIIKEIGYANLTFQRIAKKVETSRTVLYRRWNTPFDLIQEIKAHKRAGVMHGQIYENIEDSGSLRGDLLQLLTLYQNIYTVVSSEIMNAYLFEMAQNNEKITEITQNGIEKNIITMRKVLSFAEARGEKIKKVSDTTLTLPFDLVREENIVRKNIVDSKRLTVIVDEILLPVFKA